MSATMNYYQRLRQRFFSKVPSMPEDQCWQWHGVILTQAGTPRYGTLRFEGKIHLAHRAAWFVSTGIWLPSTTCVCHHCDNQLCVNVDHLFVGTNADNTMDRQIKGRHSHGERSAGAKLREADVISIRAAARMRSPRSLANEFGVSRRTVRDVLNRRSWNHIA